MVTCTWVSCVKIEKKNKQEVSDNQSFIIQKCMGMNRILCTYRLFAVGFFFACHSIYENMVNL